jgi:hypothetical protein
MNTLELYQREKELEADLDGLIAEVKSRKGVWGIFQRTYFHGDPPAYPTYLVIMYADMAEAAKKASHQSNLVTVVRNGVAMIERKQAQQARAEAEFIELRNLCTGE